MTQPIKTNIPLVAVLWVAGLVAAAQFGKIPVLYDDLGGLYPGHSISFMVSVVGLVGLIFGTTAGLLVQRLGYRRVLVGALALGALISAIEALFPLYPVMMALRVAEGFSHLGIVVAAPVLIARVTEPRHFGAAMSLWSSFFGVSFALTAWAGVTMVDLLGPHTLFLAHAAFMALVSLALEQMIPEFDDAPGTDGLTLPSLIAQHWRIYASPRIAAPALGFVFYTALYVAVLTLMPPQFTPSERILIATVMQLLSTAISLSLGVWLLSRLSAVSVVQIGFGVSAVAGVAVWAFWGSGTEFWAALVLAGALGLVQGASFASIPQLNSSDRDRAHGAGAIAQLGNLGTTTGTPVLAGMIYLGGITGLALFIVPLSIGGIVVTAALARRRARFPAS